MHKKVGPQIIVFLLTLAASGCSLFQPKPSLTWLLTLEIDSNTQDQDAVQQTISVIRTRLDRLGLQNLKVEQGGNRRILVSLPDVADRGRLKTIITTNGKLELTHVISPASPAPVATYKTKEEALASLGDTPPSNRRIVVYLDREKAATASDPRWVVIETPVIIDGRHLRSANAVPSLRTKDSYNIAFSLTPTGAQRFGAWTRANINEYLAVVLNDEVQSIAYIKSPLFDQGEITGMFTKEYALDLAHVLASGALPAPVKIVSEVPIK